ncbi:MAG: hypothetical protein KDA60_13845 [Planctomycetales bacterium]|nr:hypothetical protein [Planctomycetales bacterium]
MVSSHDRENDSDLRKAAILIASLDPETSRTLLSQIPSDQRQQIEQAVAALVDVDDAERQLIARQMAQGNSVLPNEDVDDELELRGDELGASSFAQLVAETPASVLLRVLRNEHPQTLAVLVTRMPPRQAATLLAELPPPVQVDVARRVSELGSGVPEVIEEIELEVMQQLRAEQARGAQVRGGNQALRSILAAADSDRCRDLVQNIAKQDDRLAAFLGFSRRPATTNHGVSAVNHVPTLSTFAQLFELSDALLSHVVRNSDEELWVLSLIAAPDSYGRRVCHLMQAERQVTFTAKLMNLSPTRLADVEQSQHRLVAQANYLLQHVSSVK